MVMSFSSFSLKQAETIAKRRREGCRTVELAKQYNVSVSTIKRTIRLYNSGYRQFYTLDSFQDEVRFKTLKQIVPIYQKMTNSKSGINAVRNALWRHGIQYLKMSTNQ